MPWLVPLEAIARRRGSDDPRAVGGKAAGLAWLVRSSFAVPDAWVLPADAFAAAIRELPPGCEPRSLLRAAGGKAGYARAAEARHEILKAPLPRGLEEELAELWDFAKVGSPWGLAVRSSATCEDGALVSMAGLAETRLGVRGAKGLADAVRGVWASLASGRALAYLAAHGVRDVGMAVVVQRMVEAEAAGVLFTRAPDARGRAEGERIVNAGLGLGSPVVDGVAMPDMLRLAKDGRVLEEVLARKERVTVIDEKGPAEIAATDPEAPALDRTRVATLAAIATRLEELEPVAWDVEFACDAKTTWVVQARPATGRGFPEGGDEETVWSSVNVGEALPGVATPMTWSVAGAFSEAGFRKAFATLGCSVPKHARLVGNVHGRFYLHLTHFMRIAAQVPWLDPRALVDLGGGAGGEELSAQVADVSHRGFYARFPVTAARLLKEQVKLDDIVAQYEAYAERSQRAHNALDLAILPDEGLARTILDLQDLLERTGTVMLTCASSTLGTHLVLTSLLSRVAPEGAERLAQGLPAGIRDLESARPALGIARIVNLARRDPEARAALEKETTTGLDAIPDGPTRRALQSFLELYGDRAVREAELSTPRWREDPRPVLAMVRVALRGEGAHDVERVLRGKEIADAEMAKLLPKLGIAGQTAVRHVVARAQKAARLRERMRLWVTRVLGMLREAVLDADRRLRRLMPELDADARAAAASRSPVAQIQAVFFLTMDEVVQALRASRTDLAPLVRARRAEHARDRGRPDPPATFRGVPPPEQLPPSSEADGTWRGLGASAGAVEGHARVLTSASADEMGTLQPGEILVVHTTDVGWTPMFLIAAGVVTELGGPLSHAAVVARELGVPSVVNVAGITHAVRTGDRLRIDGDRGTVERLARA
jgi:pyruvate,water dikinase